MFNNNLLPVCSAPMVGISNLAYRKLLRSYLPENINLLTFTEMLSIKRLINEKLNSNPEVFFDKNEKNLVIQLIGNDTNLFAKAIQKLENINPYGIDINMGCPARHVQKHNWGVKLLENHELMYKLLENIKKCCPYKLSVKIRAGDYGTNDIKILLNMLNNIFNAGVDFVTIHPRPAVQGHKGEVNFLLMEEIKKYTDKIIIHNGNIQTVKEAFDIINDYGMNAIMIGRAAIAKPWLFAKYAKLYCNEVNFDNIDIPNSLEEEGAYFIQAIIKYLSYLEEYTNDEKYLCERIIFYSAMSSPWLFYGHYFWKSTTKAKSLVELKNILQDFKEKNSIKMVDKIKHL